MNQLEIEFARHLAKVREYHRVAQTPAGLNKVIRLLDGLKIPLEAGGLDQGMFVRASYSDRLLEAIAEKVIPDKFDWTVMHYHGAAAEIIFLGIENPSDLNYHVGP